MLKSIALAIGLVTTIGSHADPHPPQPPAGFSVQSKAIDSRAAAVVSQANPTSWTARSFSGEPGVLYITGFHLTDQCH